MVVVLTETATQEEEELEFSETSESEDSDEMTSDEEITKTPALKSSQTNEVSSQRLSGEHEFSQDLLCMCTRILYSHMNIKFTLCETKGGKMTTLSMKLVTTKHIQHLTETIVEFKIKHYFPFMNFVMTRLALLVKLLVPNRWAILH